MMSCRRDHPRVCGEKPSASLITSVVAGSPPRMRGKDPEPPSVGQHFGITPAYAGKSSAQVNVKAVKEDHPRVCGEKGVTKMFLCGVQGSPPRMRGKVFRAAEKTGTFGITPAYAGKSHPSDHPVNVVKDHPRVCGEKQAVHSTWSAAPGSPPRMRGKVLSERYP